MHCKDPHLNGNCCMWACQLAGKNVQKDAWNCEIMVPAVRHLWCGWHVLSPDCCLPFIVLFYVCLLLNNFIGCLLIVLFTCIVYVTHRSSGVYCWISISIVQYFCKWICFMLDCLLDWCCRYMSAVTVGGFMCHLFLEMHLPFFVSWMIYDLSWWLWLPMQTIVPWVHGLLSPCWTATADPMGIFENTGEVSLLFLPCLSTNLLWWSSSQSCLIGLQSNIGIMPRTHLLSISVAGLSKPWPIDIVHICNRAMFLSLPDSAHFLNLHFINLMQASTCPLLWWWYADDIGCSMLIDLQNCLSLSETKFLPASDIIFCSIPCSVNIAVTALMRCSTDSPCNLLMMGNLLL